MAENAQVGNDTQQGATQQGENQGAGDRGRKQVKVGIVVRDKAEKTVVVAVKNSFIHPLYRRYMSKTTKFAAHDAANECRIGDQVEIVSSRPLSATKRWRVRTILKRAE